MDIQKPIELVQRYYDIYLEIEKAFNDDPSNKEDIEKQLKGILEKGMEPDSDELIDSMAEILIDKQQKANDVHNIAIKFMLSVDFYNRTQKEQLPGHVKELYDKLPTKDILKPQFSVESGKMVRNEQLIVTPEMKEYFKKVMQQLEGAK